MPGLIKSISKFTLHLPSETQAVLIQFLYCKASLQLVVLLCRASEFVLGLTSGASKAGVFSSPTAAAYWAYHLTRTGFLTVQGLSGQFFPSPAHTHVFWCTR